MPSVLTIPNPMILYAICDHNDEPVLSTIYEAATMYTQREHAQRQLDNWKEEFAEGKKVCKVIVNVLSSTHNTHTHV